MIETCAPADFVARLRHEDLPQGAVAQACGIVVNTLMGEALLYA